MEKAMLNDKPHPHDDRTRAESTLLPMLIGSLVLIVIGAVVVMTFV